MCCRKNFTLSIFVLVAMFCFSCKKERRPSSNAKDLETIDRYLAKANSEKLDYFETKKYTNKAFYELLKRENDSINRVWLFKVANRYYTLNEFDLYYATVVEIFNRSKKAKDSISLAKAYRCKADFFSYRLHSDSAYWNFFKAEQIFSRMRDHQNLAKVHLGKAILQNNEKDYLGSEASVFKALNSLRVVQDPELYFESYNLLGIVYNELGEYKKAIGFHERALQIRDLRKNSLSQYNKSTSLNNLGMVYRNMHRNHKAIELYKMALADKNLFKDKPASFAMLQDNLAYSMLMNKDYSQLPDLFYDALKVRDSLKVIPGVILSKIHLSEYYLAVKDSEEARNFASEAYALAKKSKNAMYVLQTLKQLTMVSPKNASGFSREYIRISDSLQMVERQMRNKLARIEYETDELVIQKDKLADLNKTIIYVVIILMVMASFLYIIRYQNTKNNKLLFIQAQQKANEEIYNLLLTQQNKLEEVRQKEKNSIAQEIHDGILGRLFGARLNLDSLNKKSDEKAILGRNNYILELQHIEQDLREISHDLSQEKNRLHNNFVSMLEEFIEAQQKLGICYFSLQMDENLNWEQIQNHVKINVFRILQEAVQNIHKHAQASQVAIKVLFVESVLQLQIQDNGVGFLLSKKGKGIGLLSIKSRVKACDGKLLITSNIGNGTQIRVEVPI